MKYIIKVLAVLFLLAGCFVGTGPSVKDPGVDTQTNYFRTKYHNDIAIFSTFEYLESKSVNLETPKAIRLIMYGKMIELSNIYGNG